MRVCTIDIGTNSVRALVADVDEAGGIRVLHREGLITRLGEGLSESGLLDGAAVQRTARAVNKIVTKARRLRADRFKIVATSAARNARNSQALKDRIRNLTSLKTEIISGMQEARYVCEGALNSLEVGANQVLVADIGGGSTELIFARRGEEPTLTSAGTGAVFLTERFIRHDPPLEEELSAALKEASAALQKAVNAFPSGAEELIGLGGTITTVPPILMEMEKYDASRVHNYLIMLEEMESVLSRLASMPLAERKTVKGLEPGRADIIVAGLVILKALLRVTRFKSIRVSDQGILFGLALSVVQRDVNEGPKTDRADLTE